MVAKSWIVNASPLILLWKADCLRLLWELAENVFVPQAVVSEICAKEEGKRIVTECFDEPKVSLVQDKAVPPRLLAWDLGKGETQVLVQAQLKGVERAVLDDLEARRCAKTEEIPVIGTIGIVGRAKRLGVLVRARPVLERLCDVGMYISPALMEWVLKEVGE